MLQHRSKHSLWKNNMNFKWPTLLCSFINTRSSISPMARGSCKHWLKQGWSSPLWTQLNKPQNWRVGTNFRKFVESIWERKAVYPEQWEQYVTLLALYLHWLQKLVESSCTFSFHLRQSRGFTCTALHVSSWATHALHFTEEGKGTGKNNLSIL